MKTPNQSIVLKTVLACSVVALMGAAVPAFANSPDGHGSAGNSVNKLAYEDLIGSDYGHPAVSGTAQMTNGRISSLNTSACSVTLMDSATIYDLGSGCDLTKLRVGDKVSITWRMDGQLHNASAVVAM
jgi:hypothetical protein